MCGVTEPWDAADYWSLVYPISLGIAAALGFVFDRQPWFAGTTFTLAQLPLMLVTSGAGPLILAGLLTLGVLSFPAGLAALAGAHVRGRLR